MRNFILRIFKITLGFLALLLPLSSCSGGSQIGLKRRTPSSLPVTDSCEDLSAVQLEKLFPAGAEVRIGEDVLWRVSHSSCSNQLLYQVGTTTRAFVGQGEFSVRYSVPSGSFVQRIQIGDRLIASTPIKIVDPALAGAGGLVCSLATIAGQATVDLDQSGRLLSPPATVILGLSSSSSAALPSARVAVGSVTEVPSTAASMRTYSASFSAPGFYPISFEITDAASGAIANCGSVVSVSATLVLPPVCQITLDKASVALGETLRVSLVLRESSGPALTARVSEHPIDIGGSITITPENRGYLQINGEVSGPGGIGFCSATASVGETFAFSALDDVLFSANENSHLNGGRVCPENYLRLSSVADCGGGRCFGSETICTRYRTYLGGLDAANVIQAISVSENGRHQAAGANLQCPSGFVSFGSVADCAQGNCSGSQLFCQKKVAFAELRSGDHFLQDFVISPAEGTHSPSPNCPPGFEPIGNVTDCGGGICSGNQLVCVKRGIKP